MAERAERSPSRIARPMSSLLVTMSRNVRAPEARRVMRRTSSSSASKRSAFLIDTDRRSAPTGLTTKSMAPARMAAITVSIVPWAVWTMAGTAILRSRMRRSTAMPSTSGMTRSQMRRSTGFRSGASRRSRAAAPPSTTSGV